MIMVVKYAFGKSVVGFAYAIDKSGEVVLLMPASNVRIRIGIYPNRVSFQESSNSCEVDGNTLIIAISFLGIDVIVDVFLEMLIPQLFVLVPFLSAESFR